MKGKLPVTGDILLETNESQWNLVYRGIIDELPLTGVIEIETDRRVRIKIIITEVYPPECIQTIFQGGTYTTNLKEASVSLSRIGTHVYNFLESKKWILIGEIQGENTVPIVLVHYSLIEKTFYSQKTKDECVENFLPSIGNGGPCLN